MTTRNARSDDLAETTGRAPFLAFEVFTDGGKLLPTGRTLPIVADTLPDSGAQLRAELRALGERPQATGDSVLWVGEHRYWIVDRADAFPKALADVDGIWLIWAHRRQLPRRDTPEKETHPPRPGRVTGA